MWIHRNVITPLCKPPDSLKGTLTYLEKKYYNLNVVYSFFVSHIPSNILRFMFGALLYPKHYVMLVVNYILILFLLKWKAHNILYSLLIFTAFTGGYLYFANSPDALDAYYAPFFGLCYAWSRGASKKILIIYFVVAFFHSWLVVQDKVMLFMQNATREELMKAVHTSYINMLASFFSAFSFLIFKEYLQDNIREKWVKMKKKIADQNEALQKTNEQLEAALEERETFILSFSHETRNPLNGLLGNLHILSDMKLPEEARKIVNKIHVSSKILKNIVLTILDSRRSGNSATNIHLMPVAIDMRHFIEDVSMLCGDLIEGKGLMSIIDISPLFPDILVIDPERITQVIMNLISNSIKFTQKGSIKLSFDWVPDARNESNEDNLDSYLTARDSVFIKKFGKGSDHYNSRWFSKSAKKSSGMLRIAVTDTGSGIKASQLDQIFEKFTQGETNIQSKKNLGLGLGLWISKAIVQLHKGQIFVDSHEGSGSCFTVVIPTTTDLRPTTSISSIPSAPSESRTPANRLSKFTTGHFSRKALVIEDCAINQAINKAMLTKFGIQEVLIAQNGLEGVQIFKEKGPQYFDLITCDLEMPVMKGKEAIMEIRKWEHEQKIASTKIVIISGNAIDKEMQECLNPQGNIRADEFLTKPCDYNHLVKKLIRLGINVLGPAQSLTYREKILVADDDFFNLDIIKNFAAQLGIDCLTAKNGKEAIQIYEKHIDEISIILLDNEMPILNGIEACKEIRRFIKLNLEKHKQKLQPTIFLLSGHGNDQIIEKIFDRCIQKPMTFETFRQIMTPILQKPN